MPEKVSFSYKKKKFTFSAKACNRFERIIGLMFSGKDKAQPLLFDFKKSVNFKIHSFFVFFSFVGVWLDKRGKVVEIRKITPFSMPLGTEKSYRKLLEIPLNRKNYKKVKFLCS